MKLAQKYAERYDALSPIGKHRVFRVANGLPPTFQKWNKRTTPKWNWEWAYIVRLQNALERVSAGLTKRLIIEMPPRHGKSETTTVRFPVNCLCEDPSQRFILGSYNTTLATRFSRKARKLAEELGLTISSERSAADDWETDEGGGIRAVGVGSGVTGHGANGLLIDDPVKSREEAESEVYREKVWEWYTDDLYTRLEPNAWLVVIMTRWHYDDLVGRILSQPDADEWEVLRFPALAEPNDPLGRKEGEALCPERYDEKTLAKIRLTMGEYSFSGLYQQNPTPRSGNMFPRAKIDFVDSAPADARRVRYWDKGGGKNGDPSAGVKMSMKDGIFYVEDCAGGALEIDERNRLIKNIAETERGVRVRVEQEPGSGGKESAQYTTKLLAGSSIAPPDKVSGDLMIRADPFASQWQAGNVRIVRGPWNKEFLDEHELFPNAKHDDKVAASSGAFNTLVLEPTPRVRSLSK